MFFMPYDTESQFRNVLASPLGEEGHKVAKGCTRVRMIMILDVDVTAERRHYNTHRPLKGKRLTTFCASLALLHPLLSLTHWIFRSLMLPYKSSSHSASTAVTDSLDFQVASLSYKSSSFATSRGNEKIGGTGYCVTYDTESQSRNADFISIALRAIPQPSA